MVYCPFSSTGSRYRGLYGGRQGLGGMAWALAKRRDTAERAHWGTPRHGAVGLRHNQLTRVTRPSARGMGFCVVTQVLCHDRGAAPACLGSAPVVS